MAEDKVHEVVGALAFLEKKFGYSPSVKDIAEQADFSIGTTHGLLKKALDEGLIDQRDGKFMTLSVAKAFDKK